ncbi:MAG: hypothetical protein HKO63_04930 [Acidimicrobiia bacterium]|nr:hypothetical protein [Acidimicrobiia bacterium]MBT8215555.1 hypothetical protein [Acidimicrobiia bacterium]NNF09823.1 hypothetical protein [Acidimicrobiia bacterium]NNL97531.1 hypothetical protein [Acidimicrobiia bacterium]
MMRRIVIVLCVLALVAGACGGDDSGSDPTNAVGNGSSGNGDVDFDLLGFDTGFDEGDLPDGFPVDYLPPKLVAGQVAQLGELTTVSFYSDMSFDEAVSFYEPFLGTPILVGDPGERAATWVDVVDWGGGLFEEDPLLIGFTEVSG